MEYYNNILCISAPELTGGDPGSENSKEWPVMTSEALNKYIQRYPHVRVRRGCLNTPALLSWQALRSDIQARFEAKYGDPRKMVHRSQITQNIEPDQEAGKFFRAHRFDNGKTLPEETITEYYTNTILLNAIHKSINNTKAFRKARQGNRPIWPQISALVNDLDRTQYPHTLPGNPRRLADRYNEYMKHGYQSLIHASFCNSNTEKLNEQGKVFILARWANQVDRCPSVEQLLHEYNTKAVEEGWKIVKSPITIHNYLYREDIQPLWHGYRYGELKSKEKFALQISTIMPTMRDSLWYSDGTRLNYYYLSEDGKVSTCSVYEVIDAYSEVLLGYHITPGDSENYESQYKAYRMAMQTAGHKPYQVSFDNQGGHKKLVAGEFFTKLAHMAIRTQPHNGKSKSIESVFGRFQMQILKKDWFFTGQNITAKRDESRANLEFINANKTNLPTLQEIKDRYQQRRVEWNNAKHPLSGKSRLETYYSSTNEKSPKVEAWDMIDLFWIMRPDPVTCRAYGISFTEKKIKYDYLVYKEPLVPDQEWLWNNIDKKFYIKFDPDDMSLICLYEKDATGMRFVTHAETKIVVHRGKQEQEEGQMALIRMMLDENKRLRLANKAKMEEILIEAGQDAGSYGLRTAPIQGLEKQRKKKKEKKQESFAQVEKEISNRVVLPDDEDIDYRSLY